MRQLTALLVALTVVTVNCNPPDRSADRVAPEDSTTTSATLEVAAATPRTTVTTSRSAETRNPTVAPTTAVPETTSTATVSPSAELEAGLLCRDLKARGYTYADATNYWWSEGRPDRMDADRNGIPCETVWPRADVIAFWGELPPTTTAPSVRYEVYEPTYFPESLPGSGTNYGSGCSPGSPHLPDGIWFGQIQTPSALALEFDLMCFAPTPEGEDGVGRFTNDNPQLRYVPVSTAAIVHAVAPDGFWMPMPYVDWYQDPGREGFCPADICWSVWLYVNNGHVTEVVQLWFA